MKNGHFSRVTGLMNYLLLTFQKTLLHSNFIEAFCTKKMIILTLWEARMKTLWCWILSQEKITGSKSTHSLSNWSKFLTHTVWVEPLRPIIFRLEKFRQIFLKIKRRGPPVRDMPGHKEVIKSLIIAIVPVFLSERYFPFLGIFAEMIKREMQSTGMVWIWWWHLLIKLRKKKIPSPVNVLLFFRDFSIWNNLRIYKWEFRLKER